MILWSQWFSCLGWPVSTGICWVCVVIGGISVIYLCLAFLMGNGSQNSCLYWLMHLSRPFWMVSNALSSGCKWSLKRHLLCTGLSVCFLHHLTRNSLLLPRVWSLSHWRSEYHSPYLINMSEFLAFPIGIWSSILLIYFQKHRNVKIPRPFCILPLMPFPKLLPQSSWRPFAFWWRSMLCRSECLGMGTEMKDFSEFCILSIAVSWNFKYVWSINQR